MSEFKLISPKNNSSFDPIKKTVRRYLNEQKKALSVFDQRFLIGFDQGIDPLYCTRRNKRDSKPKPVFFTFEYEGEENVFILEVLSEDKTFFKRYEFEGHRYKVYDLLPGKKYFWKVISSSDQSETFSFSLKEGPRFIYTPAMFNIRDCGNKTTLDGRYMKPGLLYRGIEPVPRKYVCSTGRADSGIVHRQTMHKRDLPYLEDLGVKLDLDLRGPIESNNIVSSAFPSKNEKVDYLRTSIAPYNEFLKTDDEEANEVKRKVIEAIANADEKPVYLHCWGGADRTGTIAFIIEGLLGLPLTELVYDYELTSFVGNITRCKPFDSNDYAWREHSNFHWMISLLLEYRKENETTQETLTRWCVDELGLDVKVIDKLKKTFLK
ncbi:MAG: tyrosine-protein phosphatase [Bacilli bacterium]|nr:tyrosine-protein phosphatase [Bacilli bacterium]